MLGSAEFRKDYGVDLAYVAGAMYKGIASSDLVIRMGRANLLSFLGTGGMPLAQIERELDRIQGELGPTRAFGANLLANLDDPRLEMATVELLLKANVVNVEAAAFTQISDGVVWYRFKGARWGADGEPAVRRRLIAKVSRAEIAESFLRPAPPAVVERLRAAGRLSAEEAEVALRAPVASDICVEADSGGHTDRGVLIVLLPCILRLRDRVCRAQGYAKSVRVGAAGGIGAPESAAAAFLMGADFVLTGSINQCTVEAGTSDAVKDLLQRVALGDTAYAPAGDMFELGARVQVVGRGLLFAPRANELYELYRRHSSLDEIDPQVRRRIEERYLCRSFAEVWDETRSYFERSNPARLREMERSPKAKMAAIFRWYFVHSTRLALRGSAEQKTDYQVQCGPAMAAFNEWVRSTPYESWRSRHVDSIAVLLMRGAEDHMRRAQRDEREEARL
ncbi:PfaD family polyunsaturated fatty acid/polyketide biosynthesis protein [Sorangium sp. So ce693]|uniref:PfaD family polyunsaturated fatty acid/polyketide biosynthesis protein n=1 Tax=Sorangium sp. So ce693 TaxID=3133318 RepID=UPI003F63487B